MFCNTNSTELTSGKISSRNIVVKKATTNILKIKCKKEHGYLFTYNLLIYNTEQIYIIHLQKCTLIHVLNLYFYHTRVYTFV